MLDDVFSKKRNKVCTAPLAKHMRSNEQILNGKQWAAGLNEEPQTSNMNQRAGSPGGIVCRSNCEYLINKAGTGLSVADSY